ncbi:lipopolysaccharide biosynthesis protein [Bradyrhizobium sp. CSS354]|uniref:lipopolysaccharide biosynthesis protein n=1 Tax=Bradyrhizobium sp. CSS354 TaxID=2699172 RepID=UPI0023AFB449|nr:lipopolysaccharide biosynthesis protein [Bradyrhizobium sp. CSS354]MDE5463895.1 oligosaccharide flippase family protein [Bradyrhizobium sp. CSS354]
MTDLKPPPSGGHAARAIKGVFWSTITAVVPSGTNFFVFLMISRYVGPVEYGLVALTVGVVSLAGVLVPYGFSEAIVQRTAIDRRHLDSVFWILLVCALLAYLALFASKDLVANLAGSELVSHLLPIVGLKLFCDAAAMVPQAVITRSMSFELLTYRTLLATLVSAVLTISLLFAGYNIWALVIAQLSSSATAMVAAMWGARYRPAWSIDIGSLRSLARYGAFSSGTRAIQALTTQADPAIIGFSLGPAQAGIYAFSRNIFQIMVGVVATPLGVVAHPMFSSIQTELDRIRKGFLTATFLSSAISFPMFVGFAMVADLAVPMIFGPKWIETVLPIRIYCALGLMACIGVIQSSLINSRGFPNWWFYYQLFAGVLTLSILALSSQLGLTMVLVLLFASTLARWPFAVVKSARLASLSVMDYLAVFAGPTAGCMTMAFVVIGAKLLCSAFPPPFQLAISVLVGAPTYVATVVLCSRNYAEEIMRLLIRRSVPPAETTRNQLTEDIASSRCVGNSDM